MRLKADHVSFAYGDRPVLEDVSLEVEAGRWVAVLGPNGSGKSTLLRVLAGLLEPATGTLRLGERPLVDLPRAEVGARIAWLPQEAAYDASTTVRDLAKLGRLPHLGLLRRAGRLDAEAVQRALDTAGVTDMAHRPLGSLSGGERQRARLARVLATGAETLLLDEPTSYLDLAHQASLLRLLRAQRDAGTAVVTVLHDPNHAARADEVVLLDGGRRVGGGSPEEVLSEEVLRPIYGDDVVVERTEGGRRVVLPA